MFRLLGAAVAAVVLSCAGAAQAAKVVYQTSGAGPAFMSNDVYLEAGGGEYLFELNSSIPVVWSFYIYYEPHWDVFYAPAPSPHAEAIWGNDNFASTSGSNFGTSTSATLSIPTMTRSFFDSGTFYRDVFGIPLGTPLYQEDRSDNPFLQIWGDAPGATEETLFSYSVKVTWLSAVPEPTTWAMMVLGFGIAGVAMRQRRLNVPAEDVDLGMVAARDAA